MALVQGTAAILHSSFYQRYLGDRDGLLAAMLDALHDLGVRPSSELSS